MKILDERFALFKLYKDSTPTEKPKIYARIIFNFPQIKKHLDKYIPNSGTVLDYGCGYGIFSNYIKMKNPNLNVVGFDISKTRINEARKSAKATGVEFTDDLKNFDFEDLKLILLIDVLLFLPTEQKINLLEKFYRYLQPNGIVFIKDTLKSDSFKFRYTNFEEKLKIKLKIYGSNVTPTLNYITPDEFVEILTNTRFKIIDLIPENHLLYPGIFIIAQK